MTSPVYMTPSPDEALHFRGKTLTPESPRPLHIPEPANIPVLENQMDPIFNDTSRYEPVRKDIQGSHGLDAQGGPCHGSSGSNAQYGTFSPYPNSSGAETASHLASFAVGSADAASDPSQGFAMASKVDGAPLMPEQTEPAGPTGGVNYQNLLDNLSHPDPRATMPEAAPEQSFHQAPVVESHQSHQSQGDPAHAHAQPQPTLPINTPNDITYQIPPQENAQPFAQSNPQAQNPQPQLYSGAPAGNPSLPASGVQTPSTGPESQASSQELSLGLKKGRVDKQGRPIKGIDDDSPWGPEVQKKYDEFLHDERIYVTEGLWDRFPMGSRLFVGKCCLLGRYVDAS